MAWTKFWDGYWYDDSTGQTSTVDPTPPPATPESTKAANYAKGNLFGFGGQTIPLLDAAAKQLGITVSDWTPYAEGIVARDSINGGQGWMQGAADAYVANHILRELSFDPKYAATFNALPAASLTQIRNAGGSPSVAQGTYLPSSPTFQATEQAGLAREDALRASQDYSQFDQVTDAIKAAALPTLAMAMPALLGAGGVLAGGSGSSALGASGASAGFDLGMGGLINPAVEAASGFGSVAGAGSLGIPSGAMINLANSAQFIPAAGAALGSSGSALGNVLSGLQNTPNPLQFADAGNTATPGASYSAEIAANQAANAANQAAGYDLGMGGLVNPAVEAASGYGATGGSLGVPAGSMVNLANSAGFIPAAGAALGSAALGGAGSLANGGFGPDASPIPGANAPVASGTSVPGGIFGQLGSALGLGAADTMKLLGTGVGGLLGSMNGSQPAGNTTITQDVPDWQKPFIMDAMNAAKTGFQNSQGSQAANTATTDAARAQLNSTIGGDYLNSNPANPAFQQMMNYSNPNESYLRGMASGDFLNSNPGNSAFSAMTNYSNPYESLLMGSAKGDFLNANPYIDATFNKAARGLQDNFNYSVMPQVSRAFGNQQAFGGNSAFNEASGQAYKALATGLGDLGTGIYGNNYANERNLMSSAQNSLLGSANATQGIRAAGASGLSGNYNTGLGYMSGAGNSLIGSSNATQGVRAAGAAGLGGNYNTARGQQLTASMSAPGFATDYTNSQFAPINNYANIVGQRYGSQQTQPYFNNPMGGALSGALAGYGLSNIFGGK